MFGAHLSIAGSLANALREAKRLNMDCVQIFTKNQRQWRVPPLRAEQIKEWGEALVQLGWEEDTDRENQKARDGQPSKGNQHRSAAALARTVSHNTYLINMASPDDALWEKSVTLQRMELERCEALGISCCVAHPGAHLGDLPRPGQRDLLNGAHGPTRSERAGLRRIIKALNRIHRELRGGRAMTCLETTVGSGTNLGYCFKQLGFIRDSVREPERIGFCFDTCHVTAAGYDMTTDERAAYVLDHFDQICGFKQLKVVHINDSVGEVGSRKDRHAHIGEGRCGRSCFRAVVNCPELVSVPKILETPKENDAKGVPMDVVNIRRLKRLVRRVSPAAKKASTM